jgi:hypothetical protein
MPTISNLHTSKRAGWTYKWLGRTDMLDLSRTGTFISAYLRRLLLYMLLTQSATKNVHANETAALAMVVMTKQSAETALYASMSYAWVRESTPPLFRIHRCTYIIEADAGDLHDAKRSHAESEAHSYPCFG